MLKNQVFQKEPEILTQNKLQNETIFLIVFVMRFKRSDFNLLKRQALKTPIP